jgi:hypothetical protein
MQSDEDRPNDRELEGTLADFVKAYREELDPQLPAIAGPRARLQETLRERLETVRPGKLRWMPVAASVMAAGLVVVAVVERGMLRRSGDPVVPKSALTPGETRRVSIDDVCRGSSEGPADESAAVPASVRQAVFQEYGIRGARVNAYEVDYLITPELGGANSIRNLWPQPYSAVWNAHVKDELENRLHGMVCAGEVDLTTAQREISQDWIGAYKKYFHRDRPD